MNYQIFPTYQKLCHQITEEIVQLIREKPKALLCIAAGHTSLGVFSQLLQRVQAENLDLSQLSFVSMDEWIDMNDQTPGSCGDFLRQNFLDHTEIEPRNICLFDGTAADTEQECKRVNQFIQQRGGLDYLVLGLGMNGHLALNEPGSSFSSRCRVVALDSVTQKVGQKYFSATAQLKGGITLGIADFLQSRRAVLMVSGQEKQSILQQVLGQEPSERLPATAIKIHPNSALYVDQAALRDC